MKLKEKVKPWIPAIAAKLYALINRPSLNRTLLRNTAITLGRLAYVCPEVIAPSMPEFIEPWCCAMRDVRDESEKESGCYGLVQMIKLNPQACVPSFVAVCDLIVSWERPPPNQLRNHFLEILTGFKGSMHPQQWQTYIASFPASIARDLHEQYGI